jgi:ribonucleoside-diphosphate reductase alpha chain
LLLFTASWCEPCTDLKQWLEDNDYEVNIIDIDVEPDIAKMYDIHSVPTLFADKAYLGREEIKPYFTELMGVPEVDTNKILADITVFNKYAKYRDDLGRRETWYELVTRNMEMHIRQYPHMEQEIRTAYVFVYDKKVMPSMRSLQFSGRPIELAHNRIYNCAYMPISHIDAFSELMFLLLGGTGGGYSVQKHHVAELPKVIGTHDNARRFLVGDSIEGWADAVKVLCEAYFLGKQQPVFDVRDIREKGAALITTGGKAPGPEPLKHCLSTLEELLQGRVGKHLRPVDAHDMCCIIADAVLAGGIRRAALISLFDRDDTEMLDCKSGEWWVKTPYRGRANNSAVLPRGEVTREQFMKLMERVEDSGCGEPGVYWSSNIDWGTNPLIT